MDFFKKLRSLVGATVVLAVLAAAAPQLKCPLHECQLGEVIDVSNQAPAHLPLRHVFQPKWINLFLLKPNVNMTEVRWQ